MNENNNNINPSFEGEEKAFPDVSFEFPKPPSQSEEAGDAFNPYASPVNSQQDSFGDTSYHFTSAELPKEDVQESANVYNQSSYEPDTNFQPPYNFNSQPSFNTSVPPQYPEKKGKGKVIAAVIIVLCLVAAGVAVALGLGSSDKPETESATDITSAVTEASTDNAVATTKPNAIQQVNSVVVAEKVRPSVVGVMTYKQGQLAGEGSGVLWMEKGEYTYIITCAHVINEKGVTYGMMLLDGRTFEAELVAADTRTDIGVIKVKATGLSVAEIGNSDSLRIGEPVYAIGNPGGSEYFGSMTDGIVSSIDRSISSTYTMTVIQHNAAINPGNSGGALVNTAGQIVGINSSKIASTDYEGMGFAVPMSIALPVAQSLVNYGYVPNRPKLGIEYAAVSSNQLYSMVVSIKGLPKGSLIIAGISADSSLANSDVKVGDLIIGVNGKEMNDSSVLLDLIDKGAVGDTLTLTLCRIESRTYKTSTFDVTITLVEDKGASKEETTAEVYPEEGYYYGGASDFEDFFNDYFGFGW